MILVDLIYFAESSVESSAMSAESIAESAESIANGAESRGKNGI